MLRVMEALDEMRNEMREGQTALREGQRRVEASLDAQSTAVRRELTAVLALTNDEVKYPPLFLVVPTRSNEGGGGFSEYFQTTNKFTVVFLCERTLTALPYGSSAGLEFTVLKEVYGKAISAFSNLMETCGPIIKLAAAAAQTAVSLTTGLKLEGLLPEGLLGAASDFVTAEAFLASYCESVSAADKDQTSASPWAKVKPNAGLESIEARAADLKPPVREAYFQFQRFLETHGFDRSKLLEHAAVVPGDDGRMHWERTPKSVSSSGPAPPLPAGAAAIKPPTPPVAAEQQHSGAEAAALPTSTSATASNLF